MKRQIKKAATDQTLDVFIQDSSSTTGAGLVGLEYDSSGLKCYYRRGATGSATALSLVTQTVGGTHTDGGFVAVDGTNMPGMYRVDLSDAICATGESVVTLMLSGAANMAPVTMEIELVDATVGNLVAAAISAATISTDAITSDKIAANAITSSELAADAIGAAQIASGAIDADAIAADAITADKIAANAIGASELADDAITAAKIATDAIDANALAADAIAEINATVDTALADIGLDHLISTSVSGTDIADDSIIAHLASSSATADWDTFDNTTDSLEALRTRGDAAWTTGGGGSAPTVTEIREEMDANSTKLASILTDTAEIGTAGAGLSAIPWNSAWNSDLNDPTAAAIADAVWDETTAGHTAVGTYGKAVGDGVTDWVTASGFSTHSAADVWSVGARTLTAFAFSVDVATIESTDATDALETAATASSTSLGLDHLLSASVAGTDVADNSIMAQLVSKSATADWDDFSHQTDSLQAIRDNHPANFADLSVTASTGLVSVGTLSTDTVTAASLAADAVAEIQSGLSTVTTAQVNAEVVDVLSVDTFALPGQGAPPATPTIVEALTWSYKNFRNKKTQTASQWSLYDDAGTTVDSKAGVTDDGTTATKQEIATGP